MQVLAIADVPEQEVDTIRDSPQVQQKLIADEAPDGLNFWFVRIQYLGGEKAWETPRHKHSFQQIRWAESGSHNYAPRKNIREGDIGYFPRAAYYGPQHIESGVIFACQYGYHGEHQRGKSWEPLRAQAMEKLNAQGSFKDGVYTGVDPETGRKRKKDAVQAIYEEAYELRYGKKFHVPDAGYHDPILIHPGAFTYYEASPGVEIRHLGRFFEHPGPEADTRLLMVKVKPGAKYTFEAGRAQHGWAISAGLQVDGKSFPESTCLYSPRGERTEISATAPFEMHIVEFPVVDPAA